MRTSPDWKLPVLSAFERRQVLRLRNDRELSRRLEREFSIAINKDEWNDITRAFSDLLLTFDAIRETRDHTARQLSSAERLARPLRQFFAELTRQRDLPALSPDREGYRRFEAHRRFSTVCVYADGTVSFADLRELIEAAPEGDVALEEIDWLEENEVMLFVLDQPEDKLEQIPDKQHAKPLTQFSLSFHDVELLSTALSHPMTTDGIVPRGEIRNNLILSVAEAFVSAGGSLGASYKPSKQKIDSPFIRFLCSLIRACPTPLQRYLLPGLPDAVREYLRKIRWSQHAKEMTHRIRSQRGAPTGEQLSYLGRLDFEAKWNAVLRANGETEPYRIPWLDQSGKADPKG